MDYCFHSLWKSIICVYNSDSHLSKDAVRYKNQQSPLAATKILAKNSH